MDRDCKIAEKLQLIHKWAHRCTDALDLADLADAHRFGEKMLAWLNEQEESNGIKLLALVEVTASGADHLEEHDPEEVEENGTVTLQ